MKTSLLLAAAVAALSLGACSQVQPGHVGVRVDNLGSNAGVEPRALGIGYYMTTPGQRIYEYPVFTQTYTWSASTHEGKDVTDESFNFQDNQGLSMDADVGISFSVDPPQAPVVFQKYRTDMDGIIAGPLKNEVRNELVTVSSTYAVQDVAGAKKAEVMAKVEQRAKDFFAPYGLRVEHLFWASRIRLPDNVQGQINNKIATEQQALAEQARVATVQAQAQQRIAQAEGEAKAIEVQGAALRTNPEVLKQLAIQKWNGELPRVTSGATPFVDVK